MIRLNRVPAVSNCIIREKGQISILVLYYNMVVLLIAYLRRGKGVENFKKFQVLLCTHFKDRPLLINICFFLFESTWVRVCGVSILNMKVSCKNMISIFYLKNFSKNFKANWCKIGKCFMNDSFRKYEFYVFLIRFNSLKLSIFEEKN